ncbi:MAG: Rho termination factor N-terminal domain-containing protein [Acholeplasmataceae bacterium]
MALLTKADTFLIGKKQFNVSEVLDNLIYLDSQTVLDFYQSVGLSIPRKLRMGALKRALDPYVKAKHVALSTLSDEVNYRLGWYEHFSESQLVNLVSLFHSEELVKEAREELWLLLLSYMFDKQVSEHDTLRLFSNKPGLVIEETKAFNEVLNPLFFDETDKIDGLDQDTFRSVLYKSSTLVEIREIGKKYGVDVPRRLKKQELAQIIKDVLQERNELTEEESQKIDKMAVIALQRYAKDRDIKASIELKKEEIIEYILANANETKEKYFLPDSNAVYDLIKPEEEEKPEVVEVKEEIIEETIVEEPVIEPVVEPVVEEVIQETTSMSEDEFNELLKELQNLSKEVELLSKEVDGLLDHEFTVISEHDYEHDHDHDYDEDEYDVEYDEIPDRVHKDVPKKPQFLFPFEVKVSEKEYANLRKIEKRAIRKKAKELERLDPVPVVFLKDNFQ